jgi:hypothetical protein
MRRSCLPLLGIQHSRFIPLPRKSLQQADVFAPMLLSCPLVRYNSAVTPVNKEKIKTGKLKKSGGP